MDWLKKNYEKVALIAGLAILLLVGISIFRSAIGFPSEFAEVASRPPAHPAAPPGLARQVEEATVALGQPPQWTFGGRSGLFVPEKHFIGADGQPATLQTTEIHPPVPNAWFEQFGLRIEDADALEQDPDGDGFTNLEEWKAHTNPTDKNSHPPYWTKLKLKAFSEEPFRFVFSSRTEDTYALNSVDVRTPVNPESGEVNIDRSQPTQFLKIGDMIAGTPFRIANFTEKEAPDKYGTNIDVSELTLENTETKEKLNLVKGRAMTSPQSVATFEYQWGPKPQAYVVKKDQEFSLPPQTDIRYKLIDVQPTKAVIVSSEAPDKPIEIGLLAP